MATKEWVTLSVKVTKEDLNLIDNIRKQLGLLKGEKPLAINRFLYDVITKELEPLRNPIILAENKGMPMVGENKFKYIPEKDNFVWQLDLGVNGLAVLGEDFSFFYLENLKRAIDNGIKQKQDFNKKVKKSVVIPSKMIKYKVK